MRLYKPVKMWLKHNQDYADFKPSSLLRDGQYPFVQVDVNPDVFCLFSGVSGDSKLVNSADVPLVY